MKNSVKLLCCFVLLITTACAISQKIFRPGPSEIPKYVSIISTKSEIDESWVAHSILIDKDFCLYATNSHMIKTGGSYEIKINDKWHYAETKGGWINWYADLAILKLTYCEPSRLPSPAVLGGEIKPGARITLITYIGIIDSIVLNTHSDWGINYASEVELKKLKLKIYKGVKIPKGKLLKLFTDYFWVRPENGQKYQFIFGMSGGVYVDKTTKKVVAIHNATTNYEAFAIPASELKKLLEKVREDLKK